jgi:hypothetical protein
MLQKLKYYFLNPQSLGYVHPRVRFVPVPLWRALEVCVWLAIVVAIVRAVLNAI